MYVSNENMLSACGSGCRLSEQLSDYYYYYINIWSKINNLDG
jgi:hypothetical protein